MWDMKKSYYGGYYMIAIMIGIVEHDKILKVRYTFNHINKKYL